mgnify:CR=1 FL=1
MKNFFKQKMALIGLVLIVTLAFSAFIGSSLWPHTYDQQLLRDQLQPPSWEHWMGTDEFGRDVMARVLMGGQISLLVGLISQSIALLIGIPLGCLAGYFRGKVDSVVMWLINVFWSFPYLLLVMALDIALTEPFKGLEESGFIENSQIIRVYIALGLVSWVLIARIVRGQIMAIKENAYVEAARAFGFSTPRIIFRHLIPNIITPIFVVLTLGFAEAIIAEAALSFLGLGVMPPTPSWGNMIETNYSRLFTNIGWWTAFFPGLAIMLAVLGLNLLGDGLRDYLDPHLKDELEGAR